MKEDVIRALEYPRTLVRSTINMDECVHAGNYDKGSGECRDCLDGPECEWLCHHDEFIAWEKKSLTELQSALEFAMGYVDAQITEWKHNSHTCQCDACNWHRRAIRLLERLTSHSA